MDEPRNLVAKDFGYLQQKLAVEDDAAATLALAAAIQSNTAAINAIAEARQAKSGLSVQSTG